MTRHEEEKAMKRLTLYTMALSAGIAMSAQSSTSACMRVDMAKEVTEAVSVERGAKNEDAITNLGDTIRVASYNIRFDNADVAEFDGPNAWVHRKEALRLRSPMLWQLLPFASDRLTVSIPIDFSFLPAPPV